MCQNLDSARGGKSALSRALAMLAKKGLRATLLATPVIAALSMPVPAQGGARKEDARTEQLPEQIMDGVRAREKIGQRWSEEAMESIMRTWLTWTADYDEGVSDLYLEERVVIPIRQEETSVKTETDYVYTEITKPLLDQLRMEGVGDADYIVAQELAHLERHKNALEKQKAEFIRDLWNEKARLEEVYAICLRVFDREEERLLSVQTGENAIIEINRGRDVLRGGFSQETLRAQDSAEKAQRMREEILAMVADLKKGKSVDGYIFTKDDGFDAGFIRAFNRAPVALEMIAALSEYIELLENGDSERAKETFSATFTNRPYVDWEPLAQDSAQKTPIAIDRLGRLAIMMEELQTEEVAAKTPEEHIRNQITQWSKKKTSPEEQMRLIRQEKAILIEAKTKEGITSGELDRIEAALALLDRAMDEIVVAKIRTMNKARIPFSKQLKLLEEESRALNSRLTSLDALLTRELGVYESRLKSLEQRSYQEGVTQEEATEIEKERQQIGITIVAIQKLFSTMDAPEDAYLGEDASCQGLLPEKIAEIQEERHQLQVAITSVEKYCSDINQIIPTGLEVVMADESRSSEEDDTEDVRTGPSMIIVGEKREDRFGIGMNETGNPFARDLESKMVASMMRNLGLRAVAMRVSSGVLDWTVQYGGKKHAHPMDPQGMFEEGLRLANAAYGDGTPEMLIKGREEEETTILAESIRGAAVQRYREEGENLNVNPQGTVTAIAMQLISRTAVPLATDKDKGVICSDVPVSDESTARLIGSDDITNDVVAVTTQRICGDIGNAVLHLQERFETPSSLYEIVDDKRLDGVWGLPATLETVMDSKNFQGMTYGLAGQFVVENPMAAGHFDLGSAWLNPTDEARDKKAIREVERYVEDVPRETEE
ncbi:TPA: hypothetical protein DCW56_00380 [Candidatus Peregrinibacteria bacterium]|nr:hypothetical protein [Candidatus Peregrinibacteria bacterium]